MIRDGKTSLTHCSGPGAQNKALQRVTIHWELAGIAAAADDNDDDGHEDEMPALSRTFLRGWCSFFHLPTPPSLQKFINKGNSLDFWEKWSKPSLQAHIESCQTLRLRAFMGEKKRKERDGEGLGKVQKIKWLWWMLVHDCVCVCVCVLVYLHCVWGFYE